MKGVSLSQSSSLCPARRTEAEESRWVAAPNYPWSCYVAARGQIQDEGCLRATKSLLQDRTEGTEAPATPNRGRRYQARTDRLDLGYD